MASNTELMIDEFKYHVAAQEQALVNMNRDYKNKLYDNFINDKLLIPLNILNMDFNDYLIQLANGTVKNYMNLTYLHNATSSALVKKTDKSYSNNNKLKSDKLVNFDTTTSGKSSYMHSNLNIANTPMPWTSHFKFVTPATNSNNEWSKVEKRLPKSNELILSMDGSPIEFKPIDILTRMHVDDLDLENLEIPEVAMLQKKLQQLQTKAEKTIKAKRIMPKKHKKN